LYVSDAVGQVAAFSPVVRIDITIQYSLPKEEAFKALKTLTTKIKTKPSI
jgi:hypothetical protein